MYRTFFHLKDEPFRLTPDPLFVHFSEPHQAALTTLLEGIFCRKGLVMITGAIGTGKTTLVHTALQFISGNNQKITIKSALLFNPTLTRDEFLEMMLEEFEVSCSATSKPRRLMALQQMLLETRRQGGTAVLIIDEAHLLSTELLEEVRLLGNSDTHGEKLLQIVLCGQPELLAILNRREMSAIRQRIAARANLRPLSLVETCAYIAERLQIAGLQGPSPFSMPALEVVHQYSEGVPRLINLLCDSCLSFAFRTRRRDIQPDIVEEAASSLGLAMPPSVVEPKPISVNEAVTAASADCSGEQKSAVDILIEAMKQQRLERVASGLE